MTAEACDPVALLNPTFPEQSANTANGHVFFLFARLPCGTLDL